ncbi:hypothetical protein V1J52_25350 [Streptomyces sp. TRM 70351]|uniref:hypothetical protein n=1 Tax=Streptomyces sp. TRM 70351 TaxID=3116552 RepID=UPI002E7AFB00|nr:hypothetical protein [Streptomyces sp. TRM 70351]MEE1931450.1 hypothetical protein [Streptomyces sp. TRM 70351]
MSTGAHVDARAGRVSMRLTHLTLALEGERDRFLGSFADAIRSASLSHGLIEHVTVHDRGPEALPVIGVFTLHSSGREAEEDLAVLCRLLTRRDTRFGAGQLADVRCVL